MRVNGKWLPCDDGEVRPVVHGMVRLANGQWLEVAFLLDAEADRTVFSQDFFNPLSPVQTSLSEPPQLAGVGGRADSIVIELPSASLRMMVARSAYGEPFTSL